MLVRARPVPFVFLLFAALLGAAALLTACGGDDGGATSADAEAPEPTGDDGEAPTTTGAGDGADPTTTAGPAPVDGSVPSVFDLVARPAEPSAVSAPAAAGTADDHIGAMFTAVAELVVADDRSLPSLWVDEFDFTAPRSSPDLVLVSTGAATSLSAEAFALIDAYARVGADAGYGPAETAYFEVRAEAASVLRDANARLHEVTAQGLDLLDPRARECVAEALLDEPPSCDGFTDAEALIAEVEAVIDEVELPDELDDFDDQISRTLDLCQLWTPILADLGDDALLLDLVVDDALLDTRFLGRSECRFEAGEDEDPSWDPEPGSEAFRSLYAAVVATGETLDYDEAFYDEAEYEVYLPQLRETIATHAETVAAQVPALLAGVGEPRARLALTWIGIQTAREAWFQRTVLAGGYDDLEDEALFADLAPCGRLSPDPDALADCSPEEAAVFSLLVDAEFNDYSVAFSAQVVEPDDVDEVVGTCGLWEEAIGAAAPDRAEAVQFQMDQTGLENMLLHGDC